MRKVTFAHFLLLLANEMKNKKPHLKVGLQFR